MRYILLIGCLLFSLNVNAQDADNINKWKYIKDVDPFTDEVTHRALAIIQEEDVNGSVLVVCDKEGFYFVVGLLDFQKLKGAKSLPKIKSILEYRIDKNPARKADMAQIDGRVGMANLDNPFIKGILAGGTTLLIRLTHEDNTTVMASLPLEGASEAVGKVVAACKVK